MILAHAALPIALALAYLPRGIAARGMASLPGGYDNANPRAQHEKLDGMYRRAVFAHQNGLEGFPGFAAAVLVASLGPAYAARGGLIDALALGYCALRVLYTGFYVADMAAPRSLTWVAGFGIVFALFGLSLALI